MLNDEQKKAVEYNKGPLLIVAGAGTGKTTVIVEKIKYLLKKKLAKPEEILALTFTEKAAYEMEERVDKEIPYGYFQMWISTYHAFADQILKEQSTHIGLNPSFRLMTEAETIIFLRKNLFLFNLEYFRPLGNPNKFLKALLDHFSRLRDEDISPEEYLKWVNKQVESEVTKKYLELANAYKTYQALKVKEGLFDFSDLIYYLLKLFRERKNILNKYKNKFKYILVDEFQDTNLAQYELIKLLCPSIKNQNLTVVGDDSQCLPANTKIKIENGEKRIDRIKVGEKVFTAVGKGYTSLAKVTKVFKREDKVTLITLTLESGEKITTTDNHKMFCFTPSTTLNKNLFYVYLMYQRNYGWRVGITNDLATRLRLEHHAEKIIGIASFNTAEEARYYESYCSVKYGLPTVPFSPRERQAIAGKWLNKLFSEIDTVKAANRIANDLHLELDSPHCITAGINRGISERVIVNLQMCYRNYRSKYDKSGFLKSPAILHIVWVETSLPQTINKLKKEGFKLTKAKKGFRYRYSSIDLKKVWEIALKLSEITNGIIDKKFAVGTNFIQHRPARIMPASHILVGNYLPVCQGKKIVYKKVTGRSMNIRTTVVYDLEIEKTHNFIANNVVVHNSIYKFRGASVSNILNFMKDYNNAHQITLKKNYRSNQTILDKSYQLIKNNDPDTLEAKLGISKKLIAQKPDDKKAINFFLGEKVEEETDFVVKQILLLKNKYKYSDFAILCRANSHSEPFIRALARASIPYQFLGPGMLLKQPEVKDLIAYLKVLYNIEDSVSMFRILSMDIFDIEAKDISFLSAFSKKTNLPLFQSIEIYLSFFEKEIYKSEFENYKKYLPFLTDKTKNQILSVYKLIKKHLGLIKKETAGQILYYFLEETKYLNKLVSYKTEKDEKIALNVSKFFNRLKNFEAEHEDASVSAVVEYLEMSMELGESPVIAKTDISSYNAVNILTTHSAKGLEFPVVFLVNLTRGRFPTYEKKEAIPIPNDLIKEILPVGDYHLEEERRLFYVGLTRAKDKAFLTASRFYGEGIRQQKISPFVYESLGEEFIEKYQIKKETEKQQLSIFDFKPQPSTLTKETKQEILSNVFSYTQLETYERCPLQYKYQFVLKIPTPPTAALSFGDTIHRTLQSFYQQYLKNKETSEKELLQIYKDCWSPLGYASQAHEARMKKEGEKMLINFFQKFHSQNIKIIDLEKFFKIKIDANTSIVGKIDRVDNKDNGEIEIIDYKTGKKPDDKILKKNFQLSIYALAATDLGLYRKKITDVHLSFYYLNDMEKVSLKKTSEDLIKVKNDIIDKVTQIRSSQFDPHVGPWCDFCPFRMICEAWQ